MSLETLKHDGETYFLAKSTIDTRIFIADNSKSILVMDRYNTILAEITSYCIQNESMLEVKNP